MHHNDANNLHGLSDVVIWKGAQDFMTTYTALLNICLFQSGGRKMNQAKKIVYQADDSGRDCRSTHKS